MNSWVGVNHDFEDILLCITVLQSLWLWSSWRIPQPLDELSLSSTNRKAPLLEESLELRYLHSVQVQSCVHCCLSFCVGREWKQGWMCESECWHQTATAALSSLHLFPCRYYLWVCKSSSCTKTTEHVSVTSLPTIRAPKLQSIYLWHHRTEHYTNKLTRQERTTARSFLGWKWVEMSFPRWN